MGNIKNGITAGIVATVVSGAMLLMNNAIHRLPNLHIGQTLAAAMGVPDHVMLGWITYVMFAVFVCGIAFAYLAPLIPFKSYLLKALAVGLASWLAVMVAVMPLAGAGAFGTHRGHIASALALVVALVYWTVLGLVYRWCIGSDSGAMRERARA